jgi:FRG domain
MTVEIRVKTWEECEEEIHKLEGPTSGSWDEIWFRGQGNAEWSLKTTLERRTGGLESVRDYLRLINRIKPAVETFTDSTWMMPSTPEIEQECLSYDLFHQFMLRCVTYMAHLRHNAFPSPLLDWTKSPYVAAYFAFARATLEKDVAIYVYRERPIGMKAGGSDTPSIFSFGPILKTHKRHFRQQSRYTVCAKFEAESGWFFKPHEAVLGMPNEKQDLLWKLVIPGSERSKVLHHFDKFNLNEFTLFDTEEGLMEMLATREFDLKTAR